MANKRKSNKTQKVPVDSSAARESNDTTTRVYNQKRVFQALKDSVNQICECGCLESEHFLSTKLKPTNCAECKCPKFRVYFKIQLLPENSHGKKG